MIRIYLCDDEQEILNHYRRLTEETLKSRGQAAEIKTFTSGEQLLFEALENPSEASIIILDVMMGQTNGIETAKKLRSAGCYAEIIYLTSNRNTVFDAFDTSPFHYLVKGSVTKARFSEILGKALTVAEQKNRDFFFCGRGAVKKRIPIYAISHFMSEGRFVTVYYSGTEFTFYAKLDTLQYELEAKGFARCHRSALVNLRFVDEVCRTELHLANQIILPLGATYAKTFKKAFFECLQDSAFS